MKRIFNFRIAPLILLSIVLAICVISFCSNSLIWAIIMFAVIAFICAIFLKPLKKVRPKLLTCLLTFFLFLGLTSLTYSRIENRVIYSENSIIECDIDMLTECDENGALYFAGESADIYLKNITVDGRKVDGKANAVFADVGLINGCKIGDRIKFIGNIAPQNLVVTDSYSMANYRNKIYHYVYCFGKSSDEDFMFAKISSGANLGDRIKLKVKKTLYSNTRNDTAAFLYAMTFGDKSGLDKNTQSAFSYTGTAHVFAVSGLHVGILASAILWFFKRIKLNNRAIRLAIMATILLIFCALCNFSSSTVRATVMTLLLMLAKALGRRNDGISSMSLAASLILLFEPIYLFEIGFLMSFFAVTGIFTMYKPLKNKIFKRLPKRLSSLLATSIGVNITLLPLMMCFFNGQTLLFIIANLLLLPILGIFFPIYLAIVFIASILPFMGWGLTVIAFPFTLLMKLIGLISKCPTLVVNFHSGFMLIAIGLLIIVALSEYIFVNKKIKCISAVIMSIALIFSMSTTLRIWGSTDAYVHCYTDKYDCQYILVDNAYGGQYLIINGKISNDAVNTTLNSMNKNKFSKIDGIVIAGEVDDFYLKKLQMYTNCSYIYTFDASDNIDGTIVSGNYVIEKGLAISYASRGNIDIVLGGTTIKVMAQDYYVDDGNCDILVTYSPIVTQASQVKYIVCDNGFENSLKNYVPGTFTFEINNDKIKVARFWRY